MDVFAKLKAHRRLLVPALCFAFAGCMMFAFRHRMRQTHLVLFAGASIALDLFFMFLVSHSHGFVVRLVEAVLWAIGMQVLWLPYLAVALRRPLATPLRVLIFVGGLIGMIVVNIVVFLLVGAPFIGGA